MNILESLPSSKFTQSKYALSQIQLRTLVLSYVLVNKQRGFCKNSMTGSRQYLFLLILVGETGCIQLKIDILRPGISIALVVNFEEDRLPTRFKSGLH